MSSTCARAKVVAAAIGTGVVVAVGALPFTLSGTEAHAIAAHLNRVGGTSTQTTPPSLPQTSDATPPVKATKWQATAGQGQQQAGGGLTYETPE